MLEATLVQWGYDVVVCADGGEAWQSLQAKDAPRLAILDWMMPHLDGIEICRRVRQSPPLQSLYIILLTAKDRREDLVEGLQAGADDYVSKPFDREELRARLHVGVRIVDLQQNLAERVRELENAIARVQQLQGLLPICSYCKKIRDDQDYWQQVDLYIAEHLGAQLTHSICPGCYEEFVQPELDELRRRKQETETSLFEPTPDN